MSKPSKIPTLLLKAFSLKGEIFAGRNFCEFCKFSFYLRKKFNWFLELNPLEKKLFTKSWNAVAKKLFLFGSTSIEYSCLSFRCFVYKHGMENTRFNSFINLPCFFRHVNTILLEIFVDMSFFFLNSRK